MEKSVVYTEKELLQPFLQTIINSMYLRIIYTFYNSGLFSRLQNRHWEIYGKLFNSFYCFGAVLGSEKNLVEIIEISCIVYDSTHPWPLHSQHLALVVYFKQFSSVGKEFAAVQETQVPPLGQEDSLEKEIANHSNILA